MGFNSAFKGLRKPGPTKGCRAGDDDDDDENPFDLISEVPKF